MQASRPCPMCKKLNVRKKFNVQEFRIVGCTYCGLVFLDNPTELQDEEQNYQEYYSASNYKNYQEHSADPELARTWCINEQRINAVTAIHNSGKLLDIGCGRGFFLSHAQAAGFTCEGVEISAAAAQFAAEHFHLPIHVCNLETNPLEGEYDVITLWHILEHFHEPLHVLKSVHALLKPGGHLFLEVPNLHSIKFMMQPNAVRWQGGNHPKYHRSFFTWNTLTQMLEKAEFTNYAPIPFVYCKNGFSKFVRSLLMRMHAGPFLSCYMQKPDY